MNNLELKDKEARRAIVEDLDICMLIEAGAGSGKTYSLVERMVALVKEKQCTVDKLAAVTFTRKAAAELKGRFQLALENAFAEETDSNKKERLNRALNELDRCFLGTIHSFCTAVLKERPIEAGLNPDFTELEELDNTLLRDMSWEEYLIQVKTENPQVLEDLLKINIKVPDLKDCYINLSTYPEVEVIRDVMPAPDLKLVREELSKLLDWAENILPCRVPDKGWDSLQILLRKALRWRNIFGLNDDLIVLRLLAAMDKKGSVIQNRWFSASDAKAAQSTFESFRKNFLSPTLKTYRENRHAKLVDFVLPAVKLFEMRRIERSKLNFHDLLIKTAGLLKGNSEVRRYFQERYSHLLVDEFQDTDPIQAEIMFYLTGRDAYEQDWRKLVPRPGALFVVGDPKQAIYRFRRADIDTYSDVKRFIAQYGGRVLYLTTNFRSVKAIGKWINPVFQTLLPEEGTSYQAAFTGLNTVRDNAEKTTCGVRKISIPKVYKNSQDKIAQIDAERIAGWIRWAIDGGISLSRTDGELKAGLTERPRPSDFMILFRYKANMDIYARTLEKYGIPFHIAGGRGFLDSKELAEILKVLKALIEPDNPVTLAAVLRSCIFGISDNQLWLFKQAGGHFNFYSKVPPGLSKNHKEIFEWAFCVMRTFREWTQKLPASAAIENIIKELGVIPYALTGELGRSRSGHLIQCLEILAAAERRGKTSFSSLVDYLILLLETGVEDEINVTPWEDDTVSLMNLHKAKGLESPVVFLANPGKSNKWLPTVHINRSGVKPEGYFVIEKRNNYSREILGQPLYWDNYSEIEQQYLTAEETRLLYAAATRAKNLLVISTYPSKPNSSPWFLFKGHFADVPEIEDCSEKIFEGLEKVTGNQLTEQDLAKARDNFLGPDSSINEPTYSVTSVTSVTSLVKESGTGPVKKSTGRGLSWGRIIHRVLEACAMNTPSNLELYVENIIAEEGRDSSEKEEVLNDIYKVLRSSLWRRMLRSQKKYVEVPISLKVKSGKYSLTSDTVIAGVIDLVFREDKGWVLVDYKTDTVETEEELSELVNYYSPQVKIYQTFWESITKERVIEVGLYFTSINRWVVV